MKRKPYYPIFVDLEGKKVIIIGGGAVAERKIETLLTYGARVQMISSEVTPGIQELIDGAKVQLVGREFREDQLDGAFLVIAATNDSGLNHQVSRIARAKGLLINAVDQPLDCNFIVPSILQRGDLFVAVSTSGKSPALAKKLREDLEKMFGDEYESLLTLLGFLRKELLTQGLPQAAKRRIFQDLVYSPVLDAIGRQEWNEVANIVNGIMKTQFSSEDIIEIVG